MEKLKEKIRTYLRAVGTMNGIAEMAEMVNKQLLTNVEDDFSVADMANIRAMNEKYMALIKGRIDEIEEKFVDVYADYYTEEDIDALLEQYNSSIAKKSREVGKYIMPRVMQISNDFSNDILKLITSQREMN